MKIVDVTSDDNRGTKNKLYGGHDYNNKFINSETN